VPRFLMALHSSHSSPSLGQVMRVIGIHSGYGPACLCSIHFADLYSGLVSINLIPVNTRLVRHHSAGTLKFSPDFSFPFSIRP